MAVRNYFLVMYRSMIVMQGRSADFAKHTINSVQKQRILVTLVKSQPKGHRFQSPSCNWAPPPIRSPSHIRPGSAKHFGPVTPTGVLPAPSARQQLPPPNGIQPMYVATPVAPGIAFPAPVALPPTSAGWPAGPPRHPPPRLPVPGTGVFLPSQGSGNSSNQPALSVANESTPIETSGCSVGKSNGGESDDQGTECNGSGEKAMSLKEEEEEEGN